MNQLQYCPEAVRETLELFGGGGPVEIRVLNAYGSRSRTDAGYFTDFAKAAAMLRSYATNPRTPGVYFVLNRFSPELLNRANNRFQERIEATATDSDILRRRWFFVDCDPERPAGISASESEHEAARRTALAVAEFLQGRQWPSPIVADSGNGFHLHWPIDVPSTDSARDMIRDALRTLATRFDSSAVSIDAKVFNAARVCKLYGTVSRKGDSSRERPHRMSAVLQRPDNFAPMDFSLVESLAAEAPQQKPRTARRANAAGGRKQTRTPILERARRYLAKIPPAVSGESGHDRTFAAACAMVRGFDLRPDDAFELLSEWNQTCSPPWSSEELRHKIEGAEAADGERGYLLTAPEDSAPLQPANVRAPGAEAPEAPDPRPEVIVDFDEKEAADAVLNELAKAPDVYTAGGSIGRVFRDEDELRFSAWTEPAIREAISETVRLINLENERQRPPRWLCQAILARPVLRGVRVLKGIKTAPSIRPDGSVINSDGFDSTTGLLLDFDPGEWPEVPAEPSREHALQALQTLAGVVGDFPFSTAADRSAWLALVLSIIGRPMIDGPCPAFAHDAPVRGSGKSLLADVAGIITTGKPPARTAWPADEGECRKRLSALLFQTPQPDFVLFDNLSGRLGGDSLEAILTASTWADRLLGSSTIREVPIQTAFSFSGNNLKLTGDAVRRTVRVRLEPREQNPEDREGFAVADLRKHVRGRRRELYSAGLVALSAFAAAGFPGAQNLPAWGSFEGWSKVIRGALVWCGFSDPAETRQQLRADADSDIDRLEPFLNALDSIDPTGVGMASEELLNLVRGEGSEPFAPLRAAIESLCEMQISEVDPRKLGASLKQFRGRVLNGQALELRKSNGRRIWFLRSLSPSCDENRASGLQGLHPPATRGNCFEFARPE